MLLAFVLLFEMKLQTSSTLIGISYRHMCVCMLLV